MAFDILGYYNKTKAYYGDAPLDEVAKDVYARHYPEEAPDFNSWKKLHGIESVIQEDSDRRNPPPFTERLKRAVSRVAPAGFEDIPTAFVHGATFGYVPEVKTPEDAGMVHKVAKGAAELAGMGVGLAGPAKLLGPAATVLGAVTRGATLGGFYGGVRKPEEGEDRISNAARDAAVFAAFGGGGGLIERGLGKLMPETVGKVLEKIRNKEALTPEEQKIPQHLGYVTSAALMGGAGAIEPAKDWHERVRNIITGLGVGAGAHGMNIALRDAFANTPEEVRSKLSPEAAAYVARVRLGGDISRGIRQAHATGIFDEEDIDRFKERYPQIRNGLNDILAEKAKNRINEALGIKLPQIAWQDFTRTGIDDTTGVTVGEPYGPEVLRPVISKPAAEEAPVDVESTVTKRLEGRERIEEPRMLPAGQGFELVGKGTEAGVERQVKAAAGISPETKGGTKALGEIEPGAILKAKEGEIHPKLQAALQKPVTISQGAAVKIKVATKDTLTEKYGSGEIEDGAPVRLTSIDELRGILKTGKLFVGEDFEGRPGISAQTMSKDTPIVAYGPNNKISAAIIFPKDAVEGKGEQLNEVLMKAGTDVSRLRFVIDGHKELLTLDQLRDVYKGETAEPGATSGAKQMESPPVTEVPLAQIKISKDVPQFKEEANEKGIVPGRELKGEKYNRTPLNAIVLWERTNGDLEVITGRHRFDLAKRLGEKTIPSQILKESDGFTAKDALTFDAEQNILDNQGSEYDYANYFRNAKITEEEANSRGVLRTERVKSAWILAKSATDQTFDAFFRQRDLGFKQAAAIAKAAPGNETLQLAGRTLAAKNPRTTPTELDNFIKALSNFKPAKQAEQGDMFGFDDTAIRTAEEQAKKVTKIVGELQKNSRIINSAIKGEGKLELTAAAAKEYGIIDPTNKTQLTEARNKIQGEIARWDKWYVDPELVARLKGEPIPVEAPAEEVKATKATATKGEHLNFEDVLAKQKVGTGKYEVGETYWWEHPDSHFKEYSHEVIIAGNEIGGKFPTYSFTEKGYAGIPPETAIPELTPKSELKPLSSKPTPKGEFETAALPGVDNILNLVETPGGEGGGKLPEKSLTKTAEIPGTEKAEGIQDFGEKIGGARKDLAERGYTMSKTAKPKDSDPVWKKQFVALEKIDGTGWTLADAKAAKAGMVTRRTGQVFASQEEAEAAIPLFAVAKQHNAYQNKDGTYSIYKKTGEHKRLKVVNQDFPSREEAMKYMAQHAEDILNIKTSFGEEILPVPEIAKREGAERRKTDATPEMFAETFAPRGIEFGNWNNQAERQEVMNHAYDGLLDLADALGIPAKALMLNGDLAIAFGARGQGLVGAKAHYEIDYGIINLTKMKGAGSLAHEWMHAFDHYLARLDTKASSEKIPNKRGDLVYKQSSDKYDLQSHGESYKSQLRPEVKEAYKTLIESMYKKAEQYVEDTKQADKFLGKARENLREQLNEMRTNIARDLAKEYTWRKNKVGLSAASTEQLAEFDRLADILTEGGDLETKYKANEKVKGGWGGRMTNDTLESLNTILKTVRNRQGFNSEQGGSLDRVRAAMTTYAQRLKMFEDAQAGTEKTKKVPTSYAIEAKKMDQARAGDYWSEPHEMAARAFASYVEDKIAEKGGQSDFLVYYAHGGILLPMIDGFIARPYPEGAERTAINKAFDKFIGEIKIRETGKGTEMYSTTEKPIGAVPIPTLDAVKSIFKGQEVTQLKDGSIAVKTQGGHDLIVKLVNQVAVDRFALEIAYGKNALKDGKVIAGKYRDGRIELLRGVADKFALSHESIHFMEDMGILDKNEVGLLQRHIQNLSSQGKFEAKNKAAIGGAEDRANFLADALTKEPKGFLGRIVAKIQDFVDKIVNAFGIRTARGIARDIETGEIFNRPGETGAGARMEPQYSLNLVGKAMGEYKDKLDKTTDKVEAAKTAKDAIAAAYEGAKRAFYPASLSKDADAVSKLMIEQMGKDFHQEAKLKGDLNEVVKEYHQATSIAAKAMDLMQTSTGVLADATFNKMSKEKQWDFIARIQKGQKQETPELQGIANTLSKMFDELYASAESVTPGAVKYRQGYFPGMWEDEAAAEKFFTERAKKMEGSKAFLQEKVFSHIWEGIAAGLKPRGTPIDMAFAKMKEVQKYVMTHRVLQQMVPGNTAILVRAGEKAPAGYTLIPEPYGIVTKGIEAKEGKYTEGGGEEFKQVSFRYAAKDDVAQLFSNYLSRSLYDSPYVGQAWQAYMGTANTLNQFQLGVGSAFHAGFTSMEAVISKFALGVKAAVRGDLGEAARLMASSPLQIYKNPMLGDAILKAYQGGSVTGQEIPQIVSWLEMAGARAHMENRLRTTTTDNMLAQWTAGKKISAAIKSPFALVEQMARPIMEWLVPRQKFGVFAEMAQEWNRQNPNATHEDTRAAMQYIWNRVDSRLGQVVYERLLTRNVAKNIVQGLMRAPGWTGGTIVEIGGGLNDLANVFRDIAQGKKPVMTDKMAYTISLLTVTGMINGIMTKLMTGEDPKDGMDLLAFRTGRKDEQGNAERMLLPTYAKDIYAYMNKPGQTLLNKTHPIISVMSDIAKNRDYYGVEIRDKESGAPMQTLQAGQYAMKAFVPFWMRGAQKTQERGSDIGTMLSPLVGIMPATAEFTKSKAQKLMSEILRDRPKGSMTREQFERNQLKQKLEIRLRNQDETARADMEKAIEEGKLSGKDRLLVLKAVRTPYEVHAFKQLSLKEAMHVYSEGTDKEKAAFLPLLRKKMITLKNAPGEERSDLLARFRELTKEE
jgi:hypothetical protein